MVKPGDKMTEVGVIPKDWKVTQIGNLKPFVTSGSRGWATYYSDKGSPFIRITNLSRDCIDLNLEDVRFVNLTSNDSEAARTQLCDGDVLISITADIGIIGHVSEKVPTPSYINQHIALVRFDPKQTSPRFVSYFLASEKPQKLFRALTDSGAKAGMNLKTIQQLRLALPPTQAEQEAIAEALSDVDSLIASLQKLIAKKKAIKHGAMQELLTGKKRLPGFSGEWKDKLFKELFYINGGVSASRDKLSTNGFCYLHYGDIHGNPRQYIDVENEFSSLPRLDIQLQDISISSLLKDGDVVFIDASEDDEGTCKHTVVRSRNNTPYISGLHTIICRSKNNDLHPLYKEYCFCTLVIKKQFLHFSAGTKVKGVNKTNIAKILLNFPLDLEEQSAIAQILSDMDAEIDQLTKKLSKYQHIKQGMMQNLLTGRIRLVGTGTNAQHQKSVPPRKHSQQFDDAVMIAGIVDAFYSEKYFLGRKKVQKLLYLCRRQEQADTSAFLKKAAGPYADSIRYKGGEPVAKTSGYIATQQNAKGSCFSRGPKLSQALEYLEAWGKQPVVDWLVSMFKYTKVDELELLATIDMAMCDLRDAGRDISVQTIKELIASSEEWRDKLKKIYFSDEDIQRAIIKCRELFGEY